MSAADKILQEIKDKDVQYVDLRFTDTRGRVHHVTFDIGMVDEEFLEDGTMFDGSSIAGWKTSNESDMQLQPVLRSACSDRFCQPTTLVMVCDVMAPGA